MKRKGWLLVGLVLAVLMAFSTLGYAFTTVQAKSLSLDANTISVGVGKTVSLKATISPSNATNKMITWTTANKDIATVNAKGVVKGVKLGRTTITAKTADGKISAKCAVSVTKLVRLTMFFGDAGIAFPSEVNKSNNPFLNVIEKAANVDLEMIQPAYADFQTKFNLVMASGDIPDIIHCWFKSDVDKYGAEGAFINWLDYIPKSECLSGLYNKDMLDQMKTSDGAVYSLNVLSAGNPDGTYARIDLLNELNGGAMPKTPNDWYQVMKKEKAKYPDSVPLSSGGGFMMMDMFFKAFGANVDGNGVNMQVTADNKYVWAFAMPKMRDAVLFHKKLYLEGLLDKTFVTNKGADFLNRKEQHDVIVFRGNASAVIGAQDEFAKIGNTKAVFGFVNSPIEAGVRPQDAYWRNDPLGWHVVAISARSKNIDAAIRVIEAFTQPQVKEGIAWGREGIEYYVNSSGRKVLNLEASNNTSYRKAYCFFNSYWYQDNLDVLAASMYSKLTPAQESAFRDAWDTGIAIRNSESAQVPRISASNFVATIADLTPKVNEARQLSLSILYKAVIGEITMDEYDRQVADFLGKYGYITDQYTKALQRVIAERGQ